MWQNINYELLNHYQTIGQMRKTFKEVFATGKQEVSINPEIMKIVRFHNGKKIVGWINACDYEVRVNEIDTGGSEIININNCSGKILNPYGAVVYFY